MFAIGPYLRRLGLDPQLGPPSYEALAALQLAHLVAVPFENLHVYHRRGVSTDLDRSYDKIVEQRRGGWCFELNGCFAALLGRLGFEVDLIACDVWDPPAAAWGPPFDHAAVLVRLDGSRFLVDVGFGDNCVHPLLLEPAERDAVPRRARIDVTGDHFVLTELVEMESGAVEWEPQVRGWYAPRRLVDFEPRSTFLQTEPGLPWTEKPFATRALDASGSRITLRRNLLRRRTGTDQYRDEEVPTDAEEGARWGGLLQEHFGMVDSLRP